VTIAVLIAVGVVLSLIVGLIIAAHTGQPQQLGTDQIVSSYLVRRSADYNAPASSEMEAGASGMSGAAMLASIPIWGFPQWARVSSRRNGTSRTQTWPQRHPKPQAGRGGDEVAPDDQSADQDTAPDKDQDLTTYLGAAGNTKRPGLQ